MKKLYRAKAKTAEQEPPCSKRTPLSGVQLSSWQQGLLLRFRIRDLVDHQAHAAFRDDVGNAVTDLNRDNRSRSIDAQHGEQVHDGVCAPTDYGHHLSPC